MKSVSVHRELNNTTLAQDKEKANRNRGKSVLENPQHKSRQPSSSGYRKKHGGIGDESNSPRGSIKTVKRKSNAGLALPEIIKKGPDDLSPRK